MRPKNGARARARGPVASWLRLRGSLRPTEVAPTTPPNPDRFQTPTEVVQTAHSADPDRLTPTGLTPTEVVQTAHSGAGP